MRMSCFHRMLFAPMSDSPAQRQVQAGAQKANSYVQPSTFDILQVELLPRQLMVGASSHRTSRASALLDHFDAAIGFHCQNGNHLAAVALDLQPSGLSNKCCSRTPNSEGSRATQEASKSPTSIKSRRWVRSLSRNEVSFMRANALRVTRRNDSVALSIHTHKCRTGED